MDQKEGRTSSWRSREHKTS